MWLSNDGKAHFTKALRRLDLAINTLMFTAIKKAPNIRQDYSLADDGASGMAYADLDHEDGV
ncbi:hypothetical protein GJ744_000667 [Endocarpon pusillum]|uniref:Uncharacterized protein n=1 Tax=Endocarpon pusillum TaxID=364733 RepID=A0A8H7E158_9EURO|nr:hypothetical protein GJ744_000667 [Endocarpon pusillum]